jgi:hypothetical protein
MSAVDVVNTTALDVRAPLLPMAPEQAKRAMAEFQALTAAMLEPTDWQSEDQNGRRLPKPFVKRSGWRKVATGYRLSLKVLSEVIDRDEQGDPIRAHVRVEVTHRESGRSWEGAGGCSISEPSFSTPNKRAKAEHDIPGTAFTRAANRAISDLVGFGQVSAEEVEAPHVVEAEAVLDDAALLALAQQLQERWPEYDAFRFLNALIKRFSKRGVEGVPESAGDALRAWHWWATEAPGATGNVRETGSHEPSTAPEATS